MSARAKVRRSFTRAVTRKGDKGAVRARDRAHRCPKCAGELNEWVDVRSPHYFWRCAGCETFYRSKSKRGAITELDTLRLLPREVKNGDSAARAN